MRQAGERGTVVAVMLFEGWSPQFVPDMTPHPFFEDNNINGVSFKEHPSSIHSMQHPQILVAQEA